MADPYIVIDYKAVAKMQEDRADGLEKALKWFVDRADPIQSKFDLYGPTDTAAAMRHAFKRAREALNGEPSL